MSTQPSPPRVRPLLECEYDVDTLCPTAPSKPEYFPNQMQEEIIAAAEHASYSDHTSDIAREVGTSETFVRNTLCQYVDGYCDEYPD